MAAGVALATPVPVLVMGDGSREVVAPLDDGEALEYSYEQSIYEVPVYERFVRHGDALRMLSARSPNIRAIEYFGWDVPIARDADGLFTADSPAGDLPQLVIRLMPGRDQTLRTPRWTRDLVSLFADHIVRIRPEERPRIVALVAGLP